MRTLDASPLVASLLVAGACSVLLGIQAAVTSTLRTPAGGVATVITIGAAVLGLWAIAVFREE